MRICTLICVCLASLGAAAAQAEGQFPYVGYVAADQVPVRSGPSEEAYPTGQLPRGATVTVYRRDPGGWLAIRPPEGSYSWIPAEQLRMTDQVEVAEVVGQQAVSWVGSRVAQSPQYRWHVRLKPGELVQVYGQARSSSEPAGEASRWCKVAPPSGEFRWVHEDWVYRDTTQKNGDGQTPSEPQPADPGQDPGQVRPARYDDNPSQVPAEDFDGALHQLDRELSLRVSRQPQRWELEDLHEATETLAASGSTTVQRGQARVLLEKVREFLNLQRRFQQPGPDDELDEGANQPGQPAGSEILPVAHEQSEAVRFDGSGWLVPVYAPHRTVPPYALVNQDGNVLWYVTPSPGLNLRRYLRKEVGIHGQQGYLPTLKIPHLTAHRVVDQQRHRDKQ